MKKTIMTSFAVCVALCSQAQDTLKTLGEVVVTANKFQNKSAFTGKVITVVTREDLEKKGGKDLAQVLTEQTGIYINDRIFSYTDSFNVIISWIKRLTILYIFCKTFF